MYEPARRAPMPARSQLPPPDPSAGFRSAATAPAGGGNTRLGLSATFREVMAGVCTPVAVVTTLDGVTPHGTTVSAFNSLSMDPPMMLVSLARMSNLLSAVRRTRRFGVNILSHDQSALAGAFAVKGASRFDGVSWTLDDGLPRLDGGAGWVTCTVQKFIDGGDHVVLLGVVIDADPRHHLAPLTYHRRTFGTHGPIPAAI